MYKEAPKTYGMGLVTGMLVGAVAGLFLAPKSGKDNRKMAAKKMKQFMEDMDPQEMRDQAEKLIDDVQNKTRKLSDQAQDEVEERTKAVKK